MLFVINYFCTARYDHGRQFVCSFIFDRKYEFDGSVERPTFQLWYQCGTVSQQKQKVQTEDKKKIEFKDLFSSFRFESYENRYFLMNYYYKNVNKSIIFFNQTPSMNSNQKLENMRNTKPYKLYFGPD